MTPTRPHLLFATAALIVGACATGRTAQDADEQKLIQWAAAHEVPVSDDAIGQLVGTAAVVSIGESAHGSEEALAFRNQAFRALAEKSGFRGIALETGYAESRRIDDFVAGGAGEAADIARRYLTSGFGNFQANVELIEWMRTYNRGRGAADRLRFFGIDLSLGGPLGSSATPRPSSARCRSSSRGPSRSSVPTRRGCVRPSLATSIRCCAPRARCRRRSSIDTTPSSVPT